jgi:trigger factor
MQINVTEIEPCKLRVSYQASPEQISNKRNEVVSIFKKAPVPGFRPGKASTDSIKMYYREQIDSSLKRALAEEAFHNTLFEKEIKPHGAPKFGMILLGDGKFSCEFEVYTKPNFQLEPYLHLEVPKPHEDEDASVLSEKIIQDLRIKYGEVVGYTDSDFVQSGDSIMISYSGSVDGQAVDSLTAENEMLTVGKSQLPTFDENLLGMKVGETREFNLLAPETGLPSLAGKTVQFKVTLHMGSKTVPCALDDAMASKLGKNTFSELKEFVLGSAQATINNKFRSDLSVAVSRKLVEDNKIDVPNWMSLSEAQYLAHASKVDWATLPDVDKEKYIEMSEKNVKLSLILDKIRELEPEAQLTDQETFEIVKRTLLNNKLPTSIDEVLQEMSRTGYLQILFSRIRDEHTVDFIVKNAKVVE